MKKGTFMMTSEFITPFRLGWNGLIYAPNITTQTERYSRILSFQGTKTHFNAVKQPEIVLYNLLLHNNFKPHIITAEYFYWHRLLILIRQKARRQLCSIVLSYKLDQFHFYTMANWLSCYIKLIKIEKNENGCCPPSCLKLFHVIYFALIYTKIPIPLELRLCYFTALNIMHLAEKYSVLYTYTEWQPVHFLSGTWGT